MATVLKVNVKDLDVQFFEDLGKRMADSGQVEIRIPDGHPNPELFSDDDFWKIIDLLDWEQPEPTGVLAPSVRALADMPVLSIYLFADKLSEKLYQLDTRIHGEAYLSSLGDDYLSVDEFLYVRCAVVAEGKEYYEEVLKNAKKISSDLSFESLLYLTDKAYQLKTGREFDYSPTLSFETYSNQQAWE